MVSNPLFRPQKLVQGTRKFIALAQEMQRIDGARSSILPYFPVSVCLQWNMGVGEAIRCLEKRVRLHLRRSCIFPLLKQLSYSTFNILKFLALANRTFDWYQSRDRSCTKPHTLCIQAIAVFLDLQRYSNRIVKFGVPDQICSQNPGKIFIDASQLKTFPNTVPPSCHLEGMTCSYVHAS